jgi:hypothetical protein
MASSRPSPSERSPADLRLRRLLVAGVIAQLPPAMQAGLRAVLLTGSVARGEGSWLASGHELRLLGDADTLLVFTATCPLPSWTALAAIEDHVARRLRAHGIVADVSVKAVHPGYLRRLPPHIFGYELRHAGQCVWGDPTVLQLIPDYPRRALPRDDAWRLLTHRLIESLPAVLTAGKRGSGDEAVEFYPSIKLHLDMATSYLVFCGEYEPSYAGRALRLHAHWGRAGTAAPPLAPDFASRVLASTEWKLAPGATGRATLARLSDLALADARALWLWELEQMVGASAAALGRAGIWRRWLRQRSWRTWARGWAGAARRLGSRTSLRLAPRWARLFARGTPRHCIYGVAAELIFALEPGRNGGWRLPTTPGGNLVTDLAGLSAQLPLPPEPVAAPPFGADVLLRQLQCNFRRLVETTRS